MDENTKHTSYKRPGIIFPLIIIAVGVILLLQNLGVLADNVWDNLWNLWPVILILIGLDSLLKREGVAGPVFFIGGGVIFLMSNFGLLAWNAWDLLFRLWPVMLIAWGLDLVLGKRSWWGAILALLLLAGIVAGVLAVGGVVAPPASQTIEWSPDGRVTWLEASLSPAVGALTIDDIRQGDELLTGRINYRQGAAIDEVKNLEAGRATYRLSWAGSQMLNPINQTSLPDWQISFSRDVPLELQVEIGAGEASLDLSELQVTDLSVDVGAGRTVVYFPNTSLSATLNNGVGETLLYLPKNADIDIRTDNGLTHLSMPSGFTQIGDESYEYASGIKESARISIHVEQGVGQVRVEWLP